MSARLFKKIKNAVEYRWVKYRGNRFTNWLRKKGCKVGDGVKWYGLKDIQIDVTRPSLIEIGNNVCFTRGSVILTHGYDWFVLRNLYNEVIASSGKVVIGDNVFLGTGCIILKGVTIGNNCIIGVHSVVTKDIPPNSVAAGIPARVIYTIEEYYEKRKKEYIEEAFAYARSIKENLKRDPMPGDFWEEFPLFMKKDMILDSIPVKCQLSSSYEYFRTHHEPVFGSFEEFLEAESVVYSQAGTN